MEEEKGLKDNVEEVKRIMRFLYCFVDIKADLVPDDSILKEFIGGSIFYKY